MPVNVIHEEIQLYVNIVVTLRGILTDVQMSVIPSYAYSNSTLFYAPFIVQKSFLSTDEELKASHKYGYVNAVIPYCENLLLFTLSVDQIGIATELVLFLFKLPPLRQPQHIMSHLEASKVFLFTTERWRNLLPFAHLTMRFCPVCLQVLWTLGSSSTPILLSLCCWNLSRVLPSLVAHLSSHRLFLFTLYRILTLFLWASISKCFLPCCQEQIKSLAVAWTRQSYLPVQHHLDSDRCARNA